MSGDTDQVRPVIDSLQDANLPELLQQVGLRQQAVEQGLVDPNNYAADLPSQVESFDLSGIKDFARRYFKQVTVEAYPIICAADNPDRAALAKALPNVGDAATVLTAILVSTGLAVPYVAPVVALIMLKVLLKPTIAAFCEGIKEAIDKDKVPV